MDDWLINNLVVFELWRGPFSWDDFSTLDFWNKNNIDPVPLFSAHLTFCYFFCRSTTSFKIDPASGVLTVNSGLDRETKAQFALTVVAKDSGSPSLSASVVVTVIIDDVNDNPPMFSQSIFYGSIREDASTGSTVLKVSTPLFFLSFFIFDFYWLYFWWATVRCFYSFLCCCMLILQLLLFPKARGFNNFSISGCLWDDRRQCPEGGAVDDTKYKSLIAG